MILLRKTILFTFLGLAFTRCNSDEAPKLITIEEYTFTIEKSQNVPAADNQSLLELSVTFENLTEFRPDIVVFESQQGEFTSGTKIDSVNVDIENTAKAYLKSDKPGTFIVSAFVGPLSASTTVTFATPFTDITLLPAIGSTVLADGSSSAIIEATASGINGAVSSDFELETNLGTFSNNSAKIILSPILNTNKVTTKLRSSESGLATITASANGIVRSTQVLFTSQPSDFDLKVVDNIPADGVSQAVIEFSYNRLSIPKQAIGPVVFVTNFGKFTNDNQMVQVSVNGDSTASAFLANTNEGVANISVTFQDQTLSVPATFTQALPEEITINLDNSTITNAPGNMVNVTANLFRDLGDVSTGLNINWIDSTSGGSNPGIFLNSVGSNSNGKSFTEYHLQDTTFNGEIFFIATLESGSNQIRGETKVFVIDN